MQDPVGFQDFQGFGQRHVTIEAVPRSGMAEPLDVEAVAAPPVEAGGWAVELFAEVLGKAGSIALQEAIAVPAPFARDVDRIVERGRADDRQEAGLQHLVDEVLAGRDDGGLFGF
ncbi:hypothetical protein [Azospirillum sp. INR13]|uniref:hypothetical protein n=1 Tax=Azospirillum sp. INR13 TaxID=2596919 RepID=UPI00351CA1EE